MTPRPSIQKNPARPLVPVVLVAAAFTLHACLSQFVFRDTDAILFSADVHTPHMQECGLCHGDVMADAELPDARHGAEEACLSCHGEWRDDCGRCHEGTPGFRPDKDRSLFFSHRDHLRRLDNSCDRCHPEAHATSAAAVMPAHEQCFTCHQMQTLFDDLECKSCHQDLAGRRLLPLDEFRHSKSFVEEHGELLRDPGKTASCSQCHDGSFCQDCHFEEKFIRLSEFRGEDVAFSFIHPGDFLHRHPSLARTDPNSCLTCHGQDTCRDCHDRAGVGFRGAQRREDGFAFHGPGVNDPSSRDFHGRAARRDILACAGCHDNGNDSNCVDCHRVGGVGGNPHPPNFRSALSRSSADVCRTCHSR